VTVSNGQAPNALIDGTPKALIIAFDGVLADTLALRASALAAAALRYDVPLHAHEWRAALPGRTLGECAAHLLSTRDAVRTDPTRLELVTLAADRAASAQLRAGVRLEPAPLIGIERALQSGVRVLLRSDSRRVDVEPLLALSGLGDLITLRCSDDPATPTMVATPAHRASPTSAIPPVEPESTDEHARSYASLIRAWRAIAQRLDQLRIAAPQREAHEASTEAAAIAASFVGTVRNVPTA
jgi:hypothetical protein